MKIFVYAALQVDDEGGVPVGAQSPSSVGPHVTLVYGEVQGPVDDIEIRNAIGAVLPRRMKMTSAGDGALGDHPVRFVHGESLFATRTAILAALAALGVPLKPQTHADYRPHISFVGQVPDNMPDAMTASGFGLVIGDKRVEPLAASDVDLSVPEYMLDAMRRGLRLHEEGRSGDGIRPHTIRDARFALRTGRWTEDKWREAAGWFPRQRGNWTKGEDTDRGSESPGFVAWLIWGDPGDERGWRYAEGVRDRLDANEAQTAYHFDALAASVTTDEGKWFRVASPGQNIARDSGKPRTPLTADDLEHLAAVDAELRAIGQHSIKADWHHLSNPKVLPEVRRTADNMAPLGYAELRFIADPEDGRGPGLYAKFDWNKAGTELVDSRTTADGRGTLWPSIEFAPRPVYDKREPGRQIGRMWVRAIGLQGDQQQPDAELDAITLAAATGQIAQSHRSQGAEAPDNGGQHLAATTTAGDAGSEEAMDLRKQYMATAGQLGLSDEELGMIKAALEKVADDDHEAMNAAYAAALKPLMAKPEPVEPQAAAEHGDHEGMGARLEAMAADFKAQVEALAAQVIEARGRADEAEKAALKARAERALAAMPGVVPAQEQYAVDLFCAAHVADPAKSAITAWEAFCAGTSADEPESTTINQGASDAPEPTEQQAAEARVRRLFQGG